MRELDFHQKDLIKRLFFSSIYKNSHPGWTSIDDLLDSPSGHVYLFDETGTPFLLGIQQISERIFWLHSFYGSQLPDHISLAEYCKSIPALSGKDLYAISSHRWFSNLLENNHFTTRDSIIQMQKKGPLFPTVKQPQENRNNLKFREVLEQDIPEIHQSCESAFAPLWRLNLRELCKAYADASIAISIWLDGRLAGYLFAAGDKENCHILRLAVAAPFQEQGLASALLCRLFHLSSDKHFLTASVNTNMRNFEAVQLYKRFGFTLENINLPVYLKHLPA